MSIPTLTGQADWYYTHGGNSVGPVPFEVLRQLVVQGQLGPSDLVWQNGLAEWIPASQVAGLFGAAAPPPADPLQMLASAARPGWRQPGPYGYAAPLDYESRRMGPSSQGQATGAFVVSLVGLLVFGVILGIIAIVMANNAKKAMARNHNFAGQGLATAAVVIGIIDLVGWAGVMCMMAQR